MKENFCGVSQVNIEGILPNQSTYLTKFHQGYDDTVRVPHLVGNKTPYLRCPLEWLGTTDHC